MREETDAMKRKERNHTADEFSSSKSREGPLISFSGMESFLGLFSTALIFCYFCIKTKVRESRYRQEIINA
jgi:hypothetical protein